MGHIKVQSGRCWKIYCSWTKFTAFLYRAGLDWRTNEETTIDQTTELTLTEEDGKTKLKIKATIYKTGPKAGMAVQGMQAGFTQQLEKLNDFLSPKK